MPRVYKASACTGRHQSNENNRRSRKASSNYIRSRINSGLIDDILSDESLSDFEPFTIPPPASPNVMYHFTIYAGTFLTFDINLLRNFHVLYVMQNLHKKKI